MKGENDMERNLLISLVTKAQKGNSAAMDELFASFYNDVYYFALKTVKDSDTACDITQETFLEIINTIGNLKEPAAFVTWMKQITYHQCTRYFKKRKDVLVEEDEDGNTSFDTLADESEGSIPSEVYEKEEFRNTILGIINELTEEQRSAVMMYYFDELTVGQIAQIQGISDGTVKSRLNYARKAIKRSVESYEKQHNIKLHSFSFLPLFMLFFGKEHMPAAKAAEVSAVVSKAASAVAAGSTAVIGGAAAVASAEATVAGAGAGIAAKIAAIPIVTKIIAGIVAASVAIGGGVALFSNKDDAHKQADCVDENHDCRCDICSDDIHFINGERSEGKVAHAAVCDYCASDLGFYDKDMDNICDECGEYPCGDSHNAGHSDGDSDGICESCGSSLNEQDSDDTAAPENREVYFELDGLCDSCGATWSFESCFCSACNFQKHTHGKGTDCGICTVCGTDLMIIDLDGWGKCDLCKEEQCGNIHPHLRDEGFEYCFICGAWMEEPIPTLEAPSFTVDVHDGVVTVHISPVEGADYYRIFINGNSMGDGRYHTTGNTITATEDMFFEGENTIFTSAENEFTSSDSDSITVYKLTSPEGYVHATGTGIEFPRGDVENAQGYIIYGEDGEYLATIGPGESYDFASVYTEDGSYLPYIQAYAEGWISSEKCDIPVSIGSNGGTIGAP